MATTATLSDVRLRPVSDEQAIDLDKGYIAGEIEAGGERYEVIIIQFDEDGAQKDCSTSKMTDAAKRASIACAKAIANASHAHIKKRSDRKIELHTIQPHRVTYTIEGGKQVYNTEIDTLDASKEDTEEVKESIRALFRKEDIPIQAQIDEREALKLANIQFLFQVVAASCLTSATDSPTSADEAGKTGAEAPVSPHRADVESDRDEDGLGEFGRAPTSRAEYIKAAKARRKAHKRKQSPHSKPGTRNPLLSTGESSSGEGTPAALRALTASSRVDGPPRSPLAPPVERTVDEESSAASDGSHHSPKADASTQPTRPAKPHLVAAGHPEESSLALGRDLGSPHADTAPTGRLRGPLGAVGSVSSLEREEGTATRSPSLRDSALGGRSVRHERGPVVSPVAHREEAETGSEETAHGSPDADVPRLSIRVPKRRSDEDLAARRSPVGSKSVSSRVFLRRVSEEKPPGRTSANPALVEQLRARFFNLH